MSHSISRLVTDLVEAEFPTPFPTPAAPEAVKAYAQDTLRDVQTYQAFVAEHPEMADDEGLLTLLACAAADAPAAGLSFDDVYAVVARAFGLPARVQ